MSTPGTCTVVETDDVAADQHELLPNVFDRIQPNDTTVTVDESVDFRQFLQDFFQAKAVPQLLLVASLLGFGIGSVVGLVRIT